MSRTRTTNQELFAISNDILKQCNQSASYNYFFREKISRFFNNNKLILKILHERRDEIIKKYATHDENGKPVTEEKEGQQHYTFPTEVAKKNWTDELTDFMNREIYIES